jgi:hypothetical protein
MLFRTSPCQSARALPNPRTIYNVLEGINGSCLNNRVICSCRKDNLNSQHAICVYTCIASVIACACVVIITRLPQFTQLYMIGMATLGQCKFLRKRLHWQSTRHPSLGDTCACGDLDHEICPSVVLRLNCPPSHLQGQQWLLVRRLQELVLLLAGGAPPAERSGRSV